MDEHTFLVNRERAVDYLNSLDKVLQLLKFLLKLLQLLTCKSYDKPNPEIC